MLSSLRLAARKKGLINCNLSEAKFLLHSGFSSGDTLRANQCVNKVEKLVGREVLSNVVYLPITL